jgi:hypothetical protein
VKKKYWLLPIILIGGVSIAAASSKISDEGYRLVRQLVSYKNLEIDNLKDLNQYMLDCYNVPSEQSATKNCSVRMNQLQNNANALQVKHDVLAQQVASYTQQHKDEEWLFIGLMADDKEFSGR